MDKLTMHTTDGVNANLERLAALFPNCVTETTDEQGNVRLAVDYDKLRVELGEVVEGNEERYQFTWPGKRDAMRLANSPIAAALRPVREDSVNFDTTQNLYIEGDNLDVLKLLRETYLGKVKMIYIDPPYNTGNDFVYEDDFSQAAGDYLANSGQYDEQDNRLVANTESNGRFHTDWLNMIYPRLKVARDLLTDDGVIFISIDDNEIENLKKICNEIFGESCFVAQFIWEKRVNRENRKEVSVRHDYILCFSKQQAVENRRRVYQLPMNEKALANYGNPDNDPRGPWKSDPAHAQAGHGTPSQFYTLIAPNGKRHELPSGRCWLYTQTEMEKAISENRIWFGQDGNGVPRIKTYLYAKERGLTPETMLFAKEVSTNEKAKNDLKELFEGKAVFETPKPFELIMSLLRISSKEGIVIDFFSGASSTAHAVMQLNVEDSGNRKFIMVQLPEVTDDKSEARKAGYANICEIGKERIRRAGKKILKELELKRDALSKEIDRMLHARPSATAQLLLKEDLEEIAGNIYKEQIMPKQKELKKVEEQLARLDIGFRVLRLDSSNMEDVYYTPDKFDAANLFTMADNVKADRSEEDLLFQVMLELDVPLSADIKREQIAGKNVFVVADGHLIATFDREVNETTVMEIAKQKPNFFVMRDASAANDNVLDNFEQIFRHYSPDTICKIL